MSEPVFDDLTEVYEAMIDWPKRLANETPFIRRVFEQHGANRVADVACGTGRHAHLFHSWGLDVQGSDISPAMIQRARASFGESDRLRWRVQGFDQPLDPARSFDAVVCLGNSLALAADANAAAEALRQLFSAVRAGGVVVVQVLNLWKIPSGPCRWQKVTQKTLSRGDATILKGVHRCDQQGYVDLAIVTGAGSAVALHSHSIPFLGLQVDDLERVARPCSAGEVTFFGGYQNQSYEAGNSADLIMVATKR